MGKTLLWQEICYALWKHPHVRGEDPYADRTSVKLGETPPRAWGRLSIWLANAYIDRNTPTCVGKTMSQQRYLRYAGKHPHVRGEDRMTSVSVSSGRETPPRAWGRLFAEGKYHALGGNTPTCVGKTNLGIGKHDAEPETPPRAWGRQTLLEARKRTVRNTPTCVGKTHTMLIAYWTHRKHPHVRGEDKAQSSP